MTSRDLEFLRQDIITKELNIGLDTSYTKVFWKNKIREVEKIEDRLEELVNELEECNYYQQGERQREIEKIEKILKIETNYVRDEMLLTLEDLENYKEAYE